jgi:hypothetical protein
MRSLAAVIASGAKQSRAARVILDCFAPLAMTNKDSQDEASVCSTALAIERRSCQDRRL